MDQSNKMGTHRMGPLIFSMALPAMISMLINALYNIVDSIFVARYSTDALTAVSLVFPLQQLVIAIAVGTGVGVNSLIARRLGEGRKRHADSAAEHGIVLSLISGVVFIVIGFFLSRPFLQAFTNKPAVLEQAVNYSSIAIGLSIFLMVSVMCEKIQQSTGDMIVPMCQGLGGAICNIILDPLLIFGIGPFPELGIRGAAIATVVGQILGMLIGLWGTFLHQKTLKIEMHKFRWRGRTVGDIFRVGLPGIIMQSVVSVMTAGMNVILIKFSEVAVSVLGVYFKLQTFIFMPVFGLNQGALPVMGYNYGARNKKRLESAYKITLGAAVVIMLIGLVLFQVIPEQMIRLFNDDPEMLAVGVPALKTISLSFLGAAFGIINSTLFQAIGRGMASLIVSVCRQLVVILPVAWLLGHFIGLNAIWYAFPIAEIAAFFISYGLVIYTYRTELRYMESPELQTEEAEA
ncbi:MATE family efflux transporter [Agathobaculum sp.]|uniref:MATE family efflux transporter n=1 Tax=Agathobaculum sp. TaxID=2048138 RepID=UPI002A7F63ED|nr:MATE family efflux transporter [Agathobaculum sp.]MDY3617834.1 MATE family efflux transporter [Agathobaculum sp.]